MGGHRFHWTVAQEDVFRWRGSNFMIISSYEPLGKKKNRAINKGAPPEIGGGGGSSHATAGLYFQSGVYSGSTVQHIIIISTTETLTVCQLIHTLCVIIHMAS